MYKRPRNKSRRARSFPQRDDISENIRPVSAQQTRYNWQIFRNSVISACGSIPTWNIENCGGPPTNFATNGNVLSHIVCRTRHRIIKWPTGSDFSNVNSYLSICRANIMLCFNFDAAFRRDRYFVFTEILPFLSASQTLSRHSVPEG